MVTSDDEGGGVSGQLAIVVREVVGKPLADLVGIVGADWLHEFRERNRDRLARRTAEILRERDVKERCGDIAQMVPLIQAAQDDDREEIQELWARLLAAALDPSRRKRVRKSFVDTLKAFDPVDALVLRALHDEEKKGLSELKHIALALEIPEYEVQTSLEHLKMHGCVEEVRNAHMPMFRGAPYGKALLRALYE
jgi:hypothetical protein